MDGQAEERRQAFSIWLRTGRRPVARQPGEIELKFNPYHDPRDGRFTFGPAGGGAGRAADTGYVRPDRDPPGRSTIGTDGATRPSLRGGVPLQVPATNQSRPPMRPGPVAGRGSNSRAFHDPITLEQAFPGLRHSPGGAILAVADSLFDLTGPANEAQAALLDIKAREIIRQIKAVDPNWHFDRLGPVDTVEGKTNELNDLRFHRAAVMLRVKNDAGPLQVETLRFVQRETDRAYEEGVELQKAGRLKPKLSDREALGNYIDGQVRLSLRRRYNEYGIKAAGFGPVRVNRKETDSSGDELTSRRPDARIGKVAFDVTLTRKTLATAQIKGFFSADFKPSSVVIIRPSQVGGEHTYIISRPEPKR